MTDYDDYDNNLAFPPQGDWADTNPRANTDRTASTIELVNKIEELNKWLDLKSEYIEKLETENAKIKNLVRMIVPFLEALVEKRLKLEYIPKVAELLTQIKEFDE